MMDAIEEEILGALRSELGRDATLTDSLDRLGVDSLRMAELASELENRFRFKVDEEVLELETVQELVDYVRTRAGRS